MSKLDKYRKGEFGYIPLSQVVDEYMNDSYNDGRKFYTNLLIMASRSWQKLVRNTLKLPVNKIIYVDKSTRTAPIPVNFGEGGLVGVYIIDECNRLQQLYPNDNYNIIEIPPPPTGCGCKKCDCNNEYCASANQVNYLSEDVVINGTTYKKITRTKLCSNGDIIEEVTEPIAKGDGSGGFTVVMNPVKKYIAKVDVKPCGCIINVPDNNKKFVDACGCTIVCCRPNNQIPVAINKNGHYKLDLERGVIHLINVKVDKILFVYKPAFENENEIMVPEYSVDYLKCDLHYRSMMFRSNVASGKIREALQLSDMEEQDLIEYIAGGINMQELSEIKSNTFYKW